MIWSKDNFNEHLSQFKAISEKQHPIRGVPYISKSHFLQFNIWGNSSHRSLCFSLLFQFVGGSSEFHSDITQSALQPHLEDRSADLRRPPAAPGPLVQSHLSHRRARFLDIPQDLKFILQLNRQGRRWVHISSLYKDNGSQRVGFPRVVIHHYVDGGWLVSGLWSTASLSCWCPFCSAPGLSGLVNLATLNLSYNKINSLTGECTTQMNKVVCIFCGVKLKGEKAMAAFTPSIRTWWYWFHCVHARLALPPRRGLQAEAAQSP